MKEIKVEPEEYDLYLGLSPLDSYYGGYEKVLFLFPKDFEKVNNLKILDAVKEMLGKGEEVEIYQVGRLEDDCDFLSDFHEIRMLRNYRKTQKAKVLRRSFFVEV